MGSAANPTGTEESAAQCNYDTCTSLCAESLSLGLKCNYALIRPHKGLKLNFFTVSIIFKLLFFPCLAAVAALPAPAAAKRVSDI